MPRFSNTISQLRGLIIAAITVKVEESKGMIDLTDAGQTVQYNSDTVMNLTDVSNTDDGTLRFSGNLTNTKDASGDGDKEYTMMREEIDSVTVEDLDALLGVISDGQEESTPTIIGTVQTYNDREGHGNPLHQIEVRFGQGVTIKLPPLAGTPEKDQSDIYVERRVDRWTINIDPNSNDIRVVATIHDDAALDVTDAHGTIILHEDAPK